MKSRAAWLLLGTALGLAGLPGCHTFLGCFTGQEAASDGFDYVLPADPTPLPDVGGHTARPASPGGVGSDPAPDGSRGGKPPFVNVSGGFKPPREDARPTEVEAPPTAVTDQVQMYPADPPALKSAEPTAPMAPMAPAKEKSADSSAKMAPLALALQCILDGHHQKAMQHLQAYDAETQEFYYRILPTLTIFAKKGLDDLTAQEVSVLDEQLHSLLETLRPKTELAIDRACFCEWVKAFGMYQALPEGHTFVAPDRPGNPGELVRLYVEVRNFGSVPRGGFYETRLASTIEVRDAKGQKVQAFDFGDGAQPLKSLARLNDYFNTYSFLVPDLPPGTYQLVLQIADETVPGTRRIARKTLEFRVSAVATRSR